MKVITIQKISGPADFNIYENKEEFDKTGIKLHTFRDAQEGDYIKSDNGFYVPVVRVNKFPDKGKVKTIIYRYHFPRQSQIVHKYRTSGDVQKMSFIYDVFCKHKAPPRVRMTAKTRLMLHYLEAGWDLMDAFDASFKIKGTFKRVQYLSEVLENPRISEYIRKSNKMNKLKEQFKKTGVNEGWLAKQCKKIVEDNKAQASLKIRALEMAREILMLRDISSEDKNGQVAKTQLTTDLKKKIKQLG